MTRCMNSEIHEHYDPEQENVMGCIVIARESNAQALPALFCDHREEVYKYNFLSSSGQIAWIP
jgi:hypothetical protein